jgi:hypothetical protein
MSPAAVAAYRREVARSGQSGRSAGLPRPVGTGKPAKKRGRFEKGSPEAKQFMSELRAKRGKTHLTGR